MDFVEIKSNNPVQIQSYQPGQITINQKNYQHNIIVTAEQVIEDALPATFEALAIEQLMALLNLKPEIVIIGTGIKQQFPDNKLRTWFTEHQIGIEFMDTAAACRTFQILTAEKRRVVAILFV